MSSIRMNLVRRYARTVIKPSPSEPDELVRHLRRTMRGPLTLLPRGVARRPMAPGELGSIRGEWVGVPAGGRTVLYLHGGGYVAGDPSTYRNLAGRLARDLTAQVLLAEYRLAPEAPFPAAVDDAAAAYRALLDRGVDPATLAVAGDSAGGGLTLALLLRLRDDGDPLPAAAVTLSPWADLTGHAPSVEAHDAGDDMISELLLRTCASTYLQGADPRTPLASPVFGDLRGLPPLLVAVDRSEVLFDDASTIVERIRESGGRAELLCRVGGLHVWPVYVPLVPESRRDLHVIVEFLDGLLR